MRLYKNLKLFKRNLIKNLDINFSSSVIIFSIRYAQVPLIMESFLGFQLANKGYKVKIILDDFNLSHWDDKQLHHGKYTSITRLNIIKKFILILRKILIINTFKHENIEYLYFSDLITIDKYALNQNDLNHATSSTRRFFEQGGVEVTDELYNWYYENSKLNCEIVKNVCISLYEKYDISLFLTSHGIYSLWGPAFDYFKSKNISTLVYGPHVYKNGEILILDTLDQTRSHDSDWQTYKNVELTNKELIVIKDYMNSRINKTAIDTALYYKEASYESKFIGRQEGGFNFILTPNVIWDGDIVERDNVFQGTVDWIIKTINFFKHSKNNLIIRYHPAESTLYNDSVKLENVINDNVSDLKNIANVYQIYSSDKIDTYEFLQDNIDVALIYDGVLMIEASWMGIPVIECGNSRCHKTDFIYRIETLEEYTELLSHKIPSNVKNKQTLIKFAYWYFFANSYPLPFITISNETVINSDGITKNLINPNINSELNTTINKIVGYV